MTLARLTVLSSAMRAAALVALVSVCVACADPARVGKSPHVATGDGLASRFPPPQGCVPVPAAPGSYAEYLRRLPLNPTGAQVHDYAGRVVNWGEAIAAVLDVDLVRTRLHGDLQQCADLAIRLKAEYRWQRSDLEELAFTLQNGQRFAWHQWRDGVRGVVAGDRHRFVETARPDASYASFRSYLAYVMTWLGSAGIKAYAAEVAEVDLEPGDLLVQNASGAIGHVTILADVCVRPGGRLYLAIQSYMPAQQAHVIKPAEGEGEGVWFTLAGLRAHQARLGPAVLRRLP